MTKKMCISCGRAFDAFWHETMCYKCHVELYRNDIKNQILTGEHSSTECEENVFCPWCAEMIEGGCEDHEFYEDGTHIYRCPECNKEFTLETSVSYSYSTQRTLPTYILNDRERARLAREKAKAALQEEKR